MKPVEVITGIPGRSRFAVSPGLEGLPPAQVEIGDGGDTEGPDGIAVFIEALVEDGGEMLVRR